MMNTFPLENDSELFNNDNALPQNSNSITRGTETEHTSNIRNGTELLDPNRPMNPFDNPQLGNNPLQLANLHKVMNEYPIAENIKLDKQSFGIQKMIIKKGWVAIKHY